LLHIGESKRENTASDLSNAQKLSSRKRRRAREVTPRWGDLRTEQQKKKKRRRRKREGGPTTNGDTAGRGEGGSTV